MKDVKCRNCNRYRHEWCRCIDDSPDPDILRGCSYFIQKTNADHIRSMTDEELAKFLDDINSQGCVCPTKNCEATCGQCIVNWLKQPYKEEQP